MSDTVFKTRVEPVEQGHTAIAKNDPVPQSSDTVEVPYMDEPNFLDKYFQIGSQWHDRDQNFYPEVQKIDGYIKSKIASGQVANSQQAVRDLLSGMEKLNNLKGESRAVIKLEVLANYIEFLTKNDHLKSNLRRYNG